MTKENSSNSQSEFTIKNALEKYKQASHNTGNTGGDPCPPDLRNRFSLQ